VEEKANMETNNWIGLVKEGLEPFREIMAVMEFEELIRVRHRLQKKGLEGMVRLLTLEIERREG
jgi:hypothetical protein